MQAQKIAKLAKLSFIQLAHCVGPSLRNWKQGIQKVFLLLGRSWKGILKICEGVPFNICGMGPLDITTQYSVSQWLCKEEYQEDTWIYLIIPIDTYILIQILHVSFLIRFRAVSWESGVLPGKIRTKYLGCFRKSWLMIFNNPLVWARRERTCH